MATVSMDARDVAAGLDILLQLSKKWQVVATTTAPFQAKLAAAMGTIPLNEQPTWKEISDRQINGVM